MRVSNASNDWHAYVDLANNVGVDNLALVVYSSMDYLYEQRHGRSLLMHTIR